MEVAGGDMPKAKGFKRPEKLATIVIDEGDYAGAELALVVNPPWQVYRDITLYMEPDGDVPSPPVDGASDEERTAYRREHAARQREQIDELDGLIALLATHVLRGWNLVDHDDQPYPPTAEGLALQEPEFIAELLGYWELAITRPNPNLANGSNDGEPNRATRRAAKKRRQS